MEAPLRSSAYRVSIGQIVEWLVWTRLVATSLGDLHVFLPLRDEGIDGIVHRISTDQYARVQVKGRRQDGVHKRIQLVVTEPELADDRAMVLAVELDRAGLELGPTALLVDAPTYRRLSFISAPGGRVFHVAQVHLPVRPGDRWEKWCMPLDELGERLLPRGEGTAVLPRRWPTGQAWKTFVPLGYRAEMELVRRMADERRLNTFKAFPDLEPNEYLAYDLETRGILGIQVKAVTLSAEGTGSVNVHVASLRPSPTTWFVIFVADSSEGPLGEMCAVVPSEVVVEELAGHGAERELFIQRDFPGRMSRWRVPLAELGSRLAEVAASLA